MRFRETLHESSDRIESRDLRSCQHLVAGISYSEHVVQRVVGQAAVENHTL